MTIPGYPTKEEIKSLSLEEIESLMEELGGTETDEPRPLEVTFDERVAAEFTKAKEAIETASDTESEIEKKQKFFDIALNTVLSHRVDNTEVRTQIKRVINSSRSRGVVQTSTYFGKFMTNKEARDIGKVVFAALRKYNKDNKISSVKPSSLNDFIKEAYKVESPIAKEVLGDFELLSLI